MNENFKFHVPVEFSKGKDKDGNAQMMLKGIASTSHKDRQGEVLIPSGFDVSYLKTDGYINWHHQLAKNPDAVIGEPTKAEITKKGLYLEGKLYPDSEMAKKAYNLAQTLEKNSTTRRLGWSIEGKVMERDPNDPKRVTKAKITGVALTPMPINANTYVSVMKAFGGEEEGLLQAEEEFELEFLEDVQKAMGQDDMIISDVKEESHAADGGKTVTITLPMGGTLKVDKAGHVSIDLGKAMTTTSARAVIPESVEDGTKPKDVSGVAGRAEKKLLKKSDIYEKLFSDNPYLEVEDAVKIVDEIMKGIEVEEE